MNTKLETTNAPKAIGPFSQGIIAGNMVFTAGQIHLDTNGKLVEGTIEEKTHQVMKNVQAILEAAGASFKDVVKVTIYMTDMTDYAKINEVYATYMSDPYPAREAICIKALPLGASVEISMIAVKSS